MRSLLPLGTAFGLLLATNAIAQDQDILALMQKEPGKYVGKIANGYLTQEMRAYTDAEVATVPVYDVDGWCRRAFGSSGANGVNSCVRSEQSAYDILKAVWDELWLPSRKVCRAFSGLDQPRNIGWIYTRIKACAEVRLEIQENVRPRSFHP
jgi:hypothetical protein